MPGVDGCLCRTRPTSCHEWILREASRFDHYSLPKLQSRPAKQKNRRRSGHPNRPRRSPLARVSVQRSSRLHYLREVHRSVFATDLPSPLATRRHVGEASPSSGRVALDDPRSSRWRIATRWCAVRRTRFGTSSLRPRHRAASAPLGVITVAHARRMPTPRATWLEEPLSVEPDLSRPSSPSEAPPLRVRTERQLPDRTDSRR